jgi:hypothetical protein
MRNRSVSKEPKKVIRDVTRSNHAAQLPFRTGSLLSPTKKQLSTTGTSYETDYYRVDDTAYFTVGWGSAYTNPTSGTIACTADSYTLARPFYVVLNAQGWGRITNSWYWEGPPSTPVGGTLYWENDGDGGASVSVGVTPDQDGAFALGIADSLTFVLRETSFSFTGGDVWGYKEDNDQPIGAASGYGNPEDPHTIDPNEDPDNGCFAISWNGCYVTSDPIPPGTGVFSVMAEAYCEAHTCSEATSSGTAGADASANASLAAYVQFTPNN